MTSEQDKKKRMIRLLSLILATLLIAEPSIAQNPFAAARTVNSQIISNWDVDQRVRLYRAFGFTPPDPKLLALEELTQDRLKKQAAEEIGATVTEEGFDGAEEQYAAQRQMSVGGMRSRLRDAGVAPETFDEFLRISILWRAVVEARFARRAAPSEEDLEATLSFAASNPSESVFLREIAIPFAERGQEGARRLAERIIADVRAGANFAAIAREVSRTPTAPRGGAVGWTPAANLPAQIGSEVLTLEPGDITGPITVPAGILILQLVDIRQEERTRDDATVTYVRFNLAIGEEAAATARSIAQTFDTCLDAELAAGTFGEGSGLIGPVPANALSNEIALTLAGLDPGEAGIAMSADGGQTMIHLCSRGVDIDPEASEALRNQIFNQRMNSYAAGYLQELLADAVIEDG